MFIVNNVSVSILQLAGDVQYTHDEKDRRLITEDLSDIPAGGCNLHAHSLHARSALAERAFCTHEDMQESLLSERL